MKKISKILVLTILCVLTVTALCACEAKPNADSSKAKTALQNNDYAVTLTNGESKAGVVALSVVEEVIGAGRGDLVAILTGSKTEKNDEGDSNTEYVKVYYFKDASTAKNFWEKMQEYISDEDSDKDSDWTVNQSGAMIYYGTSAAIKAAK